MGTVAAARGSVGENSGSPAASRCRRRTALRGPGWASERVRGVAILPARRPARGLRGGIFNSRGSFGTDGRVLSRGLRLLRACEEEPAEKGSGSCSEVRSPTCMGTQRPADCTWCALPDSTGYSTVEASEVNRHGYPDVAAPVEAALGPAVSSPSWRGSVTTRAARRRPTSSKVNTGPSLRPIKSRLHAGISAPEIDAGSLARRRAAGTRRGAAARARLPRRGQAVPPPLPVTASHQQPAERRAT
jgi:hypothetical protein